MGKKKWAAVYSIATAVVLLVYHLIDLPVRVKEGLPGWQRWREATVDWMAEVTLYQMFAWKGWLVTMMTVALLWWFHYPPKFVQQRRLSRRRAKEKHASAWNFTEPETIPMRGIEELERCHQALVKYMAIPATSPINREEIAGSTELYPRMKALCCVLDEQNIPHPDIVYDGLIIANCAKWSIFLGNLWAVRHDLEKARRVY